MFYDWVRCQDIYMKYSFKYIYYINQQNAQHLKAQIAIFFKETRNRWHCKSYSRQNHEYYPSGNQSLIFRMMSNNLVLSLVSVTVLPELLVSTRSRQVRWSSSDPELEVWLSTCKLIMSVSSSSVTTGTYSH